MEYLDQGNYCISIYVDMTKAFDTVDHDILLEKMNRYGIRWHANNFFRSYLENRCQYTVINGATSTIENIRCSVPQGSVLGPLVFASSINDLYKSVGRDYIRLFADDTVLTMHGGDLSLLVEQIRQSFKNLYRWCVCNKLTINSDKTNFVLYHTINKPMPTNLNEISMEFITVQRVKTFKYLGITLEETLNWGEHAEAICSSLLKYFGISNQIKYKDTTRVARQIYFAFIYSRIKYGIEVYGNCSATNLNKIQVMQNKLMKLLLNIDRLTPTDTFTKRSIYWKSLTYIR